MIDQMSKTKSSSLKYSHSAEVFVKQLTKLPRQNATLQRRCEVDRSPYRDHDHLQNLHTPKPPLPI